MLELREIFKGENEMERNFYEKKIVEIENFYQTLVQPFTLGELSLLVQKLAHIYKVKGDFSIYIKNYRYIIQKGGNGQELCNMSGAGGLDNLHIMTALHNYFARQKHPRKPEILTGLIDVQCTEHILGYKLIDELKKRD